MLSAKRQDVVMRADGGAIRSLRQLDAGQIDGRVAGHPRGADLNPTLSGVDVNGHEHLEFVRDARLRNLAGQRGAAIRKLIVETIARHLNPIDPFVEEPIHVTADALLDRRLKMFSRTILIE